MPRNVLMIVLLGAAGCSSPGAPWIDSVDPEAGSPGTRVRLHGHDFCGAPERVEAGGVCEPLPAGTVHFGIEPFVQATPVSWLDEEIAVDVPLGLPAGEVQVVVTVDGRSSNGVSFDVR